ncbi:MAG TPA: hypothetical protein VHQ46_02010, partial [Desulfobacteria bacterium]|nr:hypothetical protein [Desulfobacteria bacterium]
MHVYQPVNERNIYNNLYIIILVLCIVCWVCKAPEFLNMVSNKGTVQSVVKENPLLLNSGITESNKAEVSITLWSEKGDI